MDTVAKVTVKIPTPLRKLTAGADRVECSGGTIRAVLEDLESHHAGFLDKLVDDSGKQRRFINIFQNGEDIRFLDSLETECADGDEVLLIPAIAGGR